MSTTGMDSSRMAGIDHFVKTNYLDTDRYPGFSLLVSRNGEIAHRSDQGYADDAIFRIYSMSKPITSIALMQLYEQGRFQLNDPVHRFLPKWKDLEVWVDGTPTNYATRTPDRPMEIRDLLTHTSGLTYGWMARTPVDSLYRRHKIGLPHHSLEEFCDALSELPLLFSFSTMLLLLFLFPMLFVLIELLEEDHTLGVLDTTIMVAIFLLLITLLLTYRAHTWPQP